MRYFLFLLLFASPALAHPAGISHSHSAEWVVPIAMVLICAAGVIAGRRAIRVKT